MLKEELKKIVLKQQKELDRYLGVKRDFELKLINKFVTIISGIRRCGKSTLARQFLKDKKLIYYLFFEDISLSNFKFEDFLKLDEIFIKNLGKNGIYYFDEIQIVDGWEKYVRYLVDSGKLVLITGSNASMLSKELGTKLTGRNLQFELYPFSYNEFLKIKKLNNTRANFKLFLKEGGFPEYLKNNDIDIIRNLFQDIFYRDILVRNDIRNEKALRSMLLFLLSNIGKEISFNKIKQIIDVGSVNTVSNFFNSFADAYLLFSINKFDYSYKKQLINPKKVYCIDNNIISSNAFSFSENKGRLLENAVFLELKKRYKEIYYHKEEHECDFVCKNRLDIEEAIQVCYKVNNDNIDREINGLIEALDRFKLSKGTIITMNQTDTIKKDNKIIRLVKAKNWFLEKK